MLLLRTEKLPEGANWLYELKLDGFRSVAFKSVGKVHLRSRNDKDFNGRYPAIVKALFGLLDETVTRCQSLASTRLAVVSFFFGALVFAMQFLAVE